MDNYRRSLLKGASAFSLLLASSFPIYAKPVYIKKRQREIVDILGREIVLPQELTRIYVADSGLFLLFASLNKGALYERLIGMPSAFRTADLSLYHQYTRAFPQLLALPEFTAMSSGHFNSEKLIALKPDVIIVAVGTYRAISVNGVLDLLTKANIPVVVFDLSIDPFNNTPISTSIMGSLLGNISQSQAMNQFREKQLTYISQQLEKKPFKRPNVLFERAAGFTPECCLSYGNGSMGQMLQNAGGQNLGSEYIKGTYGILNQETVIYAKPDKIFLTGADWSGYNPSGDWINLGPGADLEQAKKQLTILMQRLAYKTLGAVKNKQVYAIWHSFYDSPFGFIAILQMAKWLHPDRFSHLDVDTIFYDYHTQFLPVKWDTGYWVTLLDQDKE
ncbi:ABC transporter substrate-binding protein [Proteus vulgaris]|uniref:ABC transporter substrate-binding protein n=1 Tax=Proteus vulgaris TaxID=585 RepID=UPI0018E41117|nr:ABC transporter substrate-binding protein [Proteus vulgaris]MBI6527914.1 ABC transporter substrate-binding protein [Proteus vulgaris]